MKKDGLIIGTLFLLVLVLLINGCGPTTTQCPSTLQTCGNGCIPQNALCCDDGSINNYCLKPANGCDNGTNCNSCPQGKVFCGMFCVDQGKKCCLGGVCPEDTTIDQPNQIDITMVSSPDMVCTFSKSDLWSPEMAWDGSYVCSGTVTLDFHGLILTEDKTLRLRAKSVSIDISGPELSDFDAKANTPINQIIFHYNQIGGDYFQSNNPGCPNLEIQGLELIELIPSVESPFPKQNFDVTISSTCE